MRSNRLDSGQWRRRLLSSLPRLLPLVATLSTLVVIFLTDTIKISKIECKKVTQECSPRHLEILNNQNGKLLFLVKPSQVQQEILQDPGIKNAKITTKFPNTLVAELTAETTLLELGFIVIDPQILTAVPEGSTSANPVIHELMLLANPASNYYLLNSNGELLPATESETKLHILGNTSPSQDHLRQLYEGFFMIEQVGIGIGKLWLSQNHLGLVTSQNETAFLTLEKDLTESLATLQQILSESTIDLTHAVLDLRFNNPVILSIGSTE